LSTLFRPEAIDGQRQSWLGEVRLACPLSLTALTAFAVGVAALLIAFLFAGEYTRKVRLAGVLVLWPAVDTAAATVHPPALLQARLYVPPATVGLLRPGQPVLLRYEAFGQRQATARPSGRVVQVARTPADSAECQGCIAGGPVVPMYRITVALEAQDVVVDGQAQALAAGMRVDADILLDRRRLVDWLFFAPVPSAAPSRG
jgi:HlyD family secretion protein